jgi:hypothetical protein
VHPLVARYLQDLDVLMRGIEPVERAEVVEGVREHIEASLDSTARTDADVRAALDEVGPATAVAEEASAGRPGPGAFVRRPVTSRAWLPAVVAGLEALTLLVVFLVVSTTTVVSTGSVSSTTASGRTITTQTQSSFDGSISGAIEALFASLPFWLVVIVLVAITSLWTGREKALLIALPLATAVAFGVLPTLGYALVGITGVYVGAWTAIALVGGGGGVGLWVLVRRAVARSVALASWGRPTSGASVAVTGQHPPAHRSLRSLRGAEESRDVRVEDLAGRSTYLQTQQLPQPKGLITMPRFMGFVRMEEGVGSPPQALYDAMETHIGEQAAKGVFLDGGGLFGTEDAVNFVVRNGETSRVDGPYAEAKEVVGGWAIMQYDTLEDAIAGQQEFADLHAKYWPDCSSAVVATLRQIAE